MTISTNFNRQGTHPVNPTDLIIHNPVKEEKINDCNSNLRENSLMVTSAELTLTNSRLQTATVNLEEKINDRNSNLRENSLMVISAELTLANSRLQTVIEERDKQISELSQRVSELHEKISGQAEEAIKRYKENLELKKTAVAYSGSIARHVIELRERTEENAGYKATNLEYSLLIEGKTHEMATIAAYNARLVGENLSLRKAVTQKNQAINYLNTISGSSRKRHRDAP